MLHDGERQSGGVVVLFAENSSELNPRAQQELKAIVPALLGKRNKFELRGHALQPDQLVRITAARTPGSFRTIAAWPR